MSKFALPCCTVMFYGMSVADTGSLLLFQINKKYINLSSVRDRQTDRHHLQHSTMLILLKQKAVLFKLQATAYRFFIILSVNCVA